MSDSRVCHDSGALARFLCPASNRLSPEFFIELRCTVMQLCLGIQTEHFVVCFDSTQISGCGTSRISHLSVDAESLRYTSDYNGVDLIEFVGSVELKVGF